jgi:SAM-dependent methyltransferase
MPVESIGSYRHSEIAAFYDQRAESREDLNRRLAGPDKPAHHHAGVVRLDQPLPEGKEEALDWLRRSEEALCDLVWHTIQGLSLRRPESLLDLGCGEGATAVRFSELAGNTAPDIAGITLSQRQRDVAARSYPLGSFTVGDMLAPNGLGERRFDVAYAIESTEYLGPKGLRALMASVPSRLALQGLLLIVAGTRSSGTGHHHPLAKLFDSHYRTQLSSTEDYWHLAQQEGLRRAADIDLAPLTLPYWRARRDHPALRNTDGGAVEGTVAKALETGIGE